MAQDNGLGGGQLFDPNAGAPVAQNTQAPVAAQAPSTQANLGGGQLFDPTQPPPAPTEETAAPTATDYFSNTSGISGAGDALKTIIGKGPMQTLQNVTSILMGNPTASPDLTSKIQQTAEAAYSNSKQHIQQAYQAARQGKISKAVSETGYAIPIAGGLIETLDQAHDQDIAEGHTRGGPNESAAVAGLVTAMLAPEAFEGSKGFIKNSKARLIDQFQKSGTETAAATAAKNQNVELTPGRTRTNGPRMAEKFLRSDEIEARPFKEADAAARETLESNGRAIADSIVKNPQGLSVEEQADRIQNSLRQVRQTAGEDVGRVHQQIADMAPNAELDTVPLKNAAQAAIDKLSIAPDSQFSGLESPDANKLVNFFQDFVDNKPLQISLPESKVLGPDGTPLRPAQVMEVPRTATFEDSNNLLKTLNDMVPNATTTEGGVIKQFASQLRQQMYQALEPYGLADQLKQTHTRYATVVKNLEDGIGRQILGTPNRPVSPDLVARTLMRPTAFSELGMTQLRDLLGPNVQPVGRLIWQNLLENYTDGNNLAAQWDKVPNGVKRGLYSPEQYEAINDFVKDVKQIGLPADPSRVGDVFASTSDGLPHVASIGKSNFIMHAARGVAIRIGGAKFARMLLKPENAKLMSKALKTPLTGYGANQITSALLLAARKDDEKEDSENAR